MAMHEDYLTHLWEEDKAAAQAMESFYSEPVHTLRNQTQLFAQYLINAASFEHAPDCSLTVNFGVFDAPSMNNLVDSYLCRVKGREQFKYVGHSKVLVKIGGSMAIAQAQFKDRRARRMLPTDELLVDGPVRDLIDPDRTAKAITYTLKALDSDNWA